jgi:hypothetical protein
MPDAETQHKQMDCKKLTFLHMKEKHILQGIISSYIDFGTLILRTSYSWI